MTQRPLARWTIGPVKPQGFNCLKLSISRFREVYKEFDLMVAYNQLDRREIEQINSWGVPTVNQHDYADILGLLPETGYQVHWKLYPPRFRTAAHEIVIDNDIIIERRIHEIDRFLQSDATLLYQGLNGQHGIFSPFIPTGLRVNSGIFGMPPGFDFYSQIIDKLKLVDNRWEGKFDEQGLVAAALSVYPKYYMIPLTTLPIIESAFDQERLTTPMCCGYHYVGLNYLDVHDAWNQHNNIKIL